MAVEALGRALRRALRPLALCVILRALCVAAGAAPATALEADDVCEPGSGDQACALSALQTRSTGSQESGALQHEDRQKGKVPPPITQHMIDARENWTWDLETWYDQFGVPDFAKSPLDKPNATVPANATSLGLESVKVWTTGLKCETWNGYYWPRVSFMAKELKKRLKLTGDSEEEKARLYNWTNKAALVVCMLPMDPRKGQEPWSTKAAGWYQKVFDSTSLDIPRLDDPFYQEPANLEYMEVPASCHWWTKSMLCDITYWQEKQQGKKEYKEGSYCWDEVEHPGYGYTGLGSNLSTELPHGPEGVDDRYGHPEYQHCQEHPLDDTFYKGVCPMGGHYAPGMLGIESWGTGPPQEERPEILQCLGKVGAPFTMDAMQMAKNAWDPEFDLMEKPPSPK